MGDGRRRTGDGGRETEDGKTEDRRRKTEDGKMEDGRPRTEEGGGRSTVEGVAECSKFNKQCMTLAAHTNQRFSR